LELLHGVLRQGNRNKKKCSREGTKMTFTPSPPPNPPPRAEAEAAAEHEHRTEAAEAGADADGEDPYGPVGDLQAALASQLEHQRIQARAVERAGEPAVARPHTDEVLEEFAAARLDERRRRGRG